MTTYSFNRPSFSRSDFRSVYRPSFYRHLNHLVANGFYARDLDADDHAFLEYVKVRGIANGSLPNINAVLIEELEFWHLPYAIAPRVERRAGPLPARIPETPEQREQRLLRTSAWHARRAIRKSEREIAAAELERERREWEQANENRKRRELLSDEEWEAADPAKRRKKIRFGKVVKRHYVPQWKLDERGELNEADARKAKREKKRRQREQEEIARKIEILEEARKTADDANRQISVWQRLAAPPKDEALKRSIISLLNSTPGQMWTVEQIMRGSGCTDRQFLIGCLNEMARDG